MATLTFSINSTPVTGSKSYTLSDADVQRWLDAIKTWYPITDAQGVPVPNPTNAQLLVAWANGVVGDTKRMIKTAESNAAQSSITDVGIS